MKLLLEPVRHGRGEKTFDSQGEHQKMQIICQTAAAPGGFNSRVDLWIGHDPL
jgi:hypothetical protein